MKPNVREAVRQRAGNRCEYCRLPQSSLPQTSFHIEHIIARQHAGMEDLQNLALACDRCNAFKGPNLTGIDPDTQMIVKLFHPRLDRWEDHFAVQGYLILGTTETGRATVRLLNMNAPRRVQLRETLRVSLL